MDLRDYLRLSQQGQHGGGAPVSPNAGEQGPDLGTDQNGRFVFFQGDDTSSAGMMLRRLPTGECRLKMWATDPSKPNVAITMTPAGEPTIVLANTTDTVTLTVPILKALLALAVPAVAPAAKLTTGVPT